MLFTAEQKCVQLLPIVCVSLCGGGGGLPWQPDLGQHVTLFFWASVLPYANEACANLQTLALVSLCILSAFGHERETERERIE